MKAIARLAPLILAACGGLSISDRSEHLIRQPDPCIGPAGSFCGDGWNCVDDWTDSCNPQNGATDCPAVCVPLALGQCGGIYNVPCTDGAKCISTEPQACPAGECTGVCGPPAGASITAPALQPWQCGGTQNVPCVENAEYVCVYDQQPCMDSESWWGCLGTCQPRLPQGACGGYPTVACPRGLSCVAAPNPCVTLADGEMCGVGMCAAPGEIAGMRKLESGAMQLDGTGTPFATYEIEASPDLGPKSSFVSIGIATTDSAGHFVYVDQDAVNVSSRFYRASMKTLF